MARATVTYNLNSSDPVVEAGGRMRDMITESDELESLGLGNAGDIVDRPKTMYGGGRTICASRFLWCYIATIKAKSAEGAIDGDTRAPDPLIRSRSITRIDLVERELEL